MRRRVMDTVGSGAKIRPSSTTITAASWIKESEVSGTVVSFATLWKIGKGKLSNYRDTIVTTRTQRHAGAQFRSKLIVIGHCCFYAEKNYHHSIIRCRTLSFEPKQRRSDSSITETIRTFETHLFLHGVYRHQIRGGLPIRHENPFDVAKNKRRYHHLQIRRRSSQNEVCTV